MRVSRKRVLLLGLLALSLFVGLPGRTTTSSRPAHGRGAAGVFAPRLEVQAPATPPHLYGLIGQGGLGEPIDRNLLAQQYTAGVRLRLLELGWNVLQPDGATDPNPATVAQFQARIDAFVASGPETRLVLDLGMQYPPGWLAAIDPLVDQYGNVWQAQGNGGANVYWSPRVRAYAADYIHQVFASLDFRGRLWAVRVGPYGGELLYPQSADVDENGARPAPAGAESFWAYDATAQASSPVPGWRPGADPADSDKARAFYYWYVDNLTDTFTFLLVAIRESYTGPGFPYIAPVTPGAGLWDGAANQLIARGLADADQSHYGNGDYWQRIFAHLPGAENGVLNWCSSVGDQVGSLGDDQPNWWQWSAARQQAYLAQLHGRPIYGENPGGNAYDSAGGAEGTSTMQWDFAAVNDPTYPYLGLLWVRQSDMLTSAPSGPYATLDQYARLIGQNP